jgi:hypothetical protein
MPPTELGTIPNVRSTASQSCIMRRKLKIYITDAPYPRMPAIIDHQRSCVNDRHPPCIINTSSLLWQETL